MPRPAEWSRLVPGIVALAVIVAGALAILFFARVGALHGKQFRLYAVTGEARGVLRGTEVWLAGQRVGLVRTVDFRPITVDTTRRLVIAFDVLDGYRRQIRHDSYIQIRTGGSLLGAPVLYVTIGSPSAPETRDGDTLTAKPQGESEGFTAQLGILGQDFPVIMGSLRSLGAALDSADGTVGAFLRDGRATRRLGDARERAGSLVRRATAGRAAQGLRSGVDGHDLIARARRAVAGVDSLRTLLGSDGTSIGRFRRDSTLVRNVADVRNEIAIVRALLAEPRGTAGRVLFDSAIVRRLGEVDRELGALVDDMKRRPLRYITM